MNCSSFAAAGFAAMALGVALPSVASATDYCVAPKSDCQANANTFQTLQGALDQAASTQEADRVLLGPATYLPEAGKGPFSYPSKAAPVEIVGAGRGKTVLTTSNLTDHQILTITAGPDSSMRDLTVRIPAQVSQGFRGFFTNGIARRVEVIEDQDQQSHRIGVFLGENGKLEDSTISLSTEAETTGIELFNPAPGFRAEVRGVTVAARTGVRSIGYLTMDRTRVTGGEVGVLAEGGDTTVTNSLVRQTWTYGTGLKVQSRPYSESRLTADGVTVVGQSTPDVAGIVATTQWAPTWNAEAKVTNSVIRGVANPLGVVATDTGAARISASFSDYDGPNNTTNGGASAHIEETHVTNVGDAGFADPAGGDYRLRPGSPLVDKGDPDIPQGLDLDGNALVADGNGDGFARRDLGAFELQPPPQPLPQTDTQAPLISGLRARRSNVSYKLSESARVVVKIQRRLAGKRARYRTLGKVAKPAKQGANRLKLSRRIRTKDARPGRYRAVLFAIDTAGNRSTKKAATFRVSR